MFQNTLTLTIDAVARSLIRVNQDNYGSEYRYSDAVESISLLVRHSVESNKEGKINRHNLYLERTVFATPTTNGSYYSSTITLRNGVGSNPADLLKTWQGFNTLALTLDDGLVVGEN